MAAAARTPAAGPAAAGAGEPEPGPPARVEILTDEEWGMHLRADYRHDGFIDVEPYNIGGAGAIYTPPDGGRGTKEFLEMTFWEHANQMAKGRPGYETLKTRMESRYDFEIPEKTGEYKPIHILEATGNSRIGIVMDAGESVTEYLGCLNVLTFGMVLDAASSPTGADKKPMYFQPEDPNASVTIGLTEFGFNPAIIPSIIVSNFDGSGVKSAWQYTKGDRTGRWDPMKDPPGFVEPTDVLGVKTINVLGGNYTGKERASSLEDKIGKTLGDTMIVASAMPSFRGNVINPFYGLNGGGTWRYIHPSDEPPPVPTSLVVKTGDILNAVRCIFKNVPVILERQSALGILKHFEYYPSEANPEKTAKNAVIAYDSMIAVARNRYNALIEEFRKTLGVGDALQGGYSKFIKDDDEPLPAGRRARGTTVLSADKFPRAGQLVREIMADLAKLRDMVVYHFTQQKSTLNAIVEATYNPAVVASGGGKAKPEKASISKPKKTTKQDIAAALREVGASEISASQAAQQFSVEGRRIGPPRAAAPPPAAAAPPPAAVAPAPAAPLEIVGTAIGAAGSGLAAVRGKRGRTEEAKSVIKIPESQLAPPVRRRRVAPNGDNNFENIMAFYNRDLEHLQNLCPQTDEVVRDDETKLMAPIIPITRTGGLIKIHREGGSQVSVPDMEIRLLTAFKKIAETPLDLPAVDYKDTLFYQRFTKPIKDLAVTRVGDDGGMSGGAEYEGELTQYIDDIINNNLEAEPPDDAINITVDSEKLDLSAKFIPLTLAFLKYCPEWFITRKLDVFKVLHKLIRMKNSARIMSPVLLERIKAEFEFLKTVGILRYNVFPSINHNGTTTGTLFYNAFTARVNYANTMRYANSRDIGFKVIENRMKAAAAERAAAAAAAPVELAVDPAQALREAPVPPLGSSPAAKPPMSRFPAAAGAPEPAPAGDGTLPLDEGVASGTQGESQGSVFPASPPVSGRAAAVPYGSPTNAATRAAAELGPRGPTSGGSTPRRKKNRKSTYRLKKSTNK